MSDYIIDRVIVSDSVDPYSLCVLPVGNTTDIKGRGVQGDARGWLKQYATRKMHGGFPPGKYDVVVGPGTLEHAKGVMLGVRQQYKVRRGDAEINGG